MDFFYILMNLLGLLFQEGHWMIGIGVLLVIALVTIGNGGGWFEFMDSSARYENRWNDIEFNFFTYAFSALIIGGIICLLFVALKPDAAPVLAQPTSQSAPIKRSAPTNKHTSSKRSSPAPKAKSSHKKTESHSLHK